jgi:hypothetical protein
LTLPPNDALQYRHTPVSRVVLYLYRVSRFTSSIQNRLTRLRHGLMHGLRARRSTQGDFGTDEELIYDSNSDIKSTCDLQRYKGTLRLAPSRGNIRFCARATRGKCGRAVLRAALLGHPSIRLRGQPSTRLVGLPPVISNNGDVQRSTDNRLMRTTRCT